MSAAEHSSQRQESTGRRQADDSRARNNFQGLALTIRTEGKQAVAGSGVSLSEQVESSSQLGFDDPTARDTTHASESYASIVFAEMQDTLASCDFKTL